MSRNILLFSLFSLFLSCNSSKEKTESKVTIKQPKIQVDSVETNLKEIINPVQTGIYDKIDTNFLAPFPIDSIFIDMVHNNDKNIDTSTLNRDEVLFLSKSTTTFLPDTYLNEYLNDFFRLDSLITNKKYDEYIGQLDIGMIKTCNAYINGQLIVSDDINIILWSLNYSTYEACPYTSGTKILGTLFYNGTNKNTIQLGESSGGGDAPMYWETNVYSIINTKQIITHLKSFVAEADEEIDDDYIEYLDTSFQINILNSGFEVIAQPKD